MRQMKENETNSGGKRVIWLRITLNQNSTWQSDLRGSHAIITLENPWRPESGSFSIPVKSTEWSEILMNQKCPPTPATPNSQYFPFTVNTITIHNTPKKKRENFIRLIQFLVSFFSIIAVSDLLFLLGGFSSFFLRQMREKKASWIHRECL